MPYKVFFVEDETITREGIRDNVDWQSSGFEFCGEAADGEMALPLLRTARPDVLITDIKMPFMDGLQLSKIVRERMPWVKIIILSGHDEFVYAQQAIKLGVADYLLKPITVNSLQGVLQKLALQLDKEKHEQENLKKLQEQVSENHAMLRERFLFKLVMGTVSPAEVAEMGQALGLDLHARHYLVTILKIELRDRSDQHDLDEYQRIQAALFERIEKNPDAYVLKRDWGDLVLIMKGDTSQYLEDERDALFDEIARNLAPTRYKLTVGTGTVKHNVTELCQSFVEALSFIQNLSNDEKGLTHAFEQAKLFKVDKSAVENYLHHGVKDDFDAFFCEHISPLCETALKSSLIKNYIVVDVVLAVVKLVNDLGGDVDKVLPELDSMEIIMSNIRTMDDMRKEIYKIIAAALAYRDSQPRGQYKELIYQVRRYIEQHYAEAELSLNDVAAFVNLSASHFSVVFGQESGCTFKEYLTQVRMGKAKELLRMTGLRSADIAYQVGYSDPHYFSFVFKKHTGLSPSEFRAQALPA